MYQSGEYSPRRSNSIFRVRLFVSVVQVQLCDVALQQLSGVGYGDVRSDPSCKSCFEGIRAETVMPVKSAAGKLVEIVDVEAEGDIDAAEIASFANLLAPLLATENEV